MRLHRIALRDFRGVEECTVELAETGVTIVEGDNETGKSSLAEGVDLILEYLDSSKAGQVKAVKPVDADVGPEVEIEMSAGEYRFTYAKRWLRRAQTTLTVHVPSPEQLTGREAHERVTEILESSADMALWRALRLEQGVDLAQARLGESQTLMRALDAASGSSSTGDEAADLVERVDKEFGRYFTPTGQPNKEYRATRDSEADAQAQVAKVTAEIATLEHDIDRHASIERRLADAQPRREEQAKLVAELEASERQITEMRGEVDRLGGQLEVAELHEEEARRAVVDRAALSAQVHSQEEDCRRLADELGSAEAAVGTAEKERASLLEARTEAHEARRAAEDGAELARQDHEHHEQLMWRITLRVRHEAVKEATAKRTEAAEFLETCRIDAELLQRIEEAETLVAQSRAVLAANRTVVHLESLSDQEITVDGQVRDLAAGDVVEETVSGTLDVTVPERLHVQVSAGADTQELAEHVAESEEARDRLLRRANVDDITAARAQMKKRDSMTQADQEAGRTLKTNLIDLTAEGIVGKLARLDADIALYESERADERPMPPDLESAEEAVAVSDAALETAAARLEAADEALGKAGSEHRAAGENLAAQQALLDQATSDRDALRAQLSQARSGTADEVLDASLATRESALRSAQSELDTASAELEQRDPETVAASLANGRAALERLEESEKNDAADLQHLEGRLESVGQQGLFDQLAEAKSLSETAGNDLEALERRASAAKLLHEVLHRHREAARRRYRAPLEAKIEQLGRIVFGDDLSVELDADLRIVRRTLDGVTVPFDSLSTGAREQLCAIERLASASLVSSDGGAPVVFDDALGYSDPDRLRRLGAVLGIAGQESQVLLLTCTPDRYSHVGNATVVRLAQD